MKNFENLFLEDNSKNFNCRLEKLGKINVFCGKNNSGKTTLLKAVADAKKRQIGFFLTEEKIKNTYPIVEYIDHENGPDIDPDYPYIFGKAKEYVLRYFNEEL